MSKVKEAKEEKVEETGNKTLEDWQRRVLGSHYEEELGKFTETRELMDVDTLIHHADTKQKLGLPTLGAYVYYKPLRIQDRVDINEIKHTDPDIQRDLRNRRKVYLLLSRSDPRYTEEIVNAMAGHLIDTILTEHLAQEEESFLLPLMRRRSTGLRLTRRLSEQSS